MKAKIFVNLPVRDLKKAMDFYSSVGFSNNKQFTDNTAAAMQLNDDIYVMLLTHEKFKQFTPKQISDSSKSTEVLNSLALENKDQVNEMFDKAIKAGGAETRPAEDLGFMFSKSFSDVDGHIWEPFWMNPEHVQ